MVGGIGLEPMTL